MLLIWSPTIDVPLCLKGAWLSATHSGSPTMPRGKNYGKWTRKTTRNFTLVDNEWRSTILALFILVLGLLSILILWILWKNLDPQTMLASGTEYEKEQATLPHDFGSFSRREIWKSPIKIRENAKPAIWHSNLARNKSRSIFWAAQSCLHISNHLCSLDSVTQINIHLKKIAKRQQQRRKKW